MSMVFHDLRSLIGIIQGYLNLISEEEWFEALGDTAKDIFAALERNSKAMLSLVTELSDVKQLDDDASVLDLEQVPLRQFLSNFVREAEVSTSAKGIDLISSFDRNIPSKASFDPARIRQVLQNLLSNAIKFSNPQTRITFYVEVEEGQLSFSIRDEGQGIPESEHHKLFKWFGRTSIRPTANEGSTGLGLSICKRIVERHGGQIGFRSQIGFGSTFYFRLPLSETPDAFQSKV
jgi:hypothetical protein